MKEEDGEFEVKEEDGEDRDSLEDDIKAKI